MRMKDAKEIPIKEVGYTHGHCFRNVHDFIQKHGGTPVTGWLAGNVLSPYNPLVQTWVHHCVWRSPEGELLDLTPLFGADAAWFVEDSEAQLQTLGDGLVRCLPERYEAIVKEPKVLKAIALLTRADEALYKHRDTKKEAHYCRSASKLLKFPVNPHGEAGLRILQPFCLGDSSSD